MSKVLGTGVVAVKIWIGRQTTGVALAGAEEGSFKSSSTIFTIKTNWEITVIARQG